MANGGRLPRAPQEASERAVAPEPRAVLTRSIGSKTSSSCAFSIAFSSRVLIWKYFTLIDISRNY